jgi:sulfite exporter TauE/SafE
MLFLTAFLTGLFGSFHCAGMCGPIAFALPSKNLTGLGFYFSRLLYNFGRIFTYSLLGLLLGLFGSGLKMAGIQQSLSIAAAVFIFAWALFQLMGWRSLSVQPLKWLGKGWFSKLMGNTHPFSLFMIGLLNGLLPCGFVYLALVGASVTQNALDGTLFMACFGAGTFPMMFGVSVIGQFLSQSVRSRLNALSPYFAIFIAVLFLLRGLNLGIPYVSPKIKMEQMQADSLCH